MITESSIDKIAFFSEDTNYYYKLMPTADWPTVMVSSTPMHRFCKLSPKRDTELKIKEIMPVKGSVLDTCCGLGYTAILSAKYAKTVVTFERDENMIKMAGINPYSAQLFSNSKIAIRHEDVFSAIKKLEPNQFDRVIHDPPTFKYSPMLYNQEFYNEIFRVAAKSAIIYHYCPHPHKTRNVVFYKTLLRKLSNVGFKDIIYREESSGLRMVKK